MKILLLTLMLVLAGCATTYEASRTMDDGSTTSMYVKSYREFPGGISIEYNRESGAFILTAGEVKNDTQVADVVKALAPALLQAAPLP